MRLSYPGIPPAIEPEKVIAGLSKIMGKKNWHPHQFMVTTQLEYYPYYFFSFEKKQVAVNAHSGKSSRVIAADFEGQVHKAKFEVEHSHEPQVLKKTVTIEHAKKIALQTNTEKTQTQNNTVVPVPVQKIKAPPLVYYIPLWKATIIIGKQEYDILYSAISGRILENQKIPLRKPGIGEITYQTLIDLKNPKNWALYGKELAKETIQFLKNH